MGRRIRAILVTTAMVCGAGTLWAEGGSHGTGHSGVNDQVITNQRAMLAANTVGGRFGPQSPRDIDSLSGRNPRSFHAAPSYRLMNLCNIHFHENAEHRGGDFTRYAGNGDGNGFGTGYQYDGHLSDLELAPLHQRIGVSAHGDLVPGDTIEVHYVHSSALVTPGPTLGSCLSDTTANPQLRVETQVFVLVNDPNALDFRHLTQVGEVNGYHQALHIPSNTGRPLQYAGSTTGPGYNQIGSPFQVSWSVRPRVAKVNILTVGAWLQNNVFGEDHAHGVRNLVVNPDLLSAIDY